ncbi:BamA/TamA family outer membrane protein [Spirosoma telluris]|uniref:BamA/TamA family outer membrane protein n=1 Tax=Spirosoma telluris TaxID=2183553 RepID=UPI002FC31D47
MKFYIGLFVGFLLLSLSSITRCMAQMPLADTMSVKNTTPIIQPTPPLHDIADLVKRWYPRLHITPHDSSNLQEGKRFLLVIPQIGYTLQTRALVAVLVNTPFRKPGANMSSISGQLSYTQNNQIILTANSQIWSRNNRYLWTNDWRLMHYPQATYGLGMYTTTDREINMDYAYFRFYQSYLRRLAPNFYGGVGYYLDLHWNIDSYIEGPNRVHELVRISRYSYGVQGRSVSSGPALHLLYDNRSNAINPSGGLYLNAVLRANMEFLGSDDTYKSLLVEARKYIPLS